MKTKPKSPDELYPIPSMIARFINIYMPSVRRFSTRTIQTYHESLLSFLDFLESEKGASITEVNTGHFSKSVVDEYLAWLTNIKKNKAATVRLRLVALRAFTVYCAQEDPRLADLMAGPVSASLPKKPKEEPVKYLSSEELELLFSLPSNETRKGLRDRCFLTLTYALGARMQEMLGLKLKNITDKTDYYSFLLHGKGSKKRTAVLNKNKTAAKILENYLSVFHPSPRLDDDYLFYTMHAGMRHSMHPSTVASMMRKYEEQAKEIMPSFPHLHCHMLRHAFAMTLSDAGVDIYLIAQMMGHSSPATTMIYAKTSEQRLRAILEKAEVDGGNDDGATKKWEDEDNIDDYFRKLIGMKKKTKG